MERGKKKSIKRKQKKANDEIEQEIISITSPEENISQKQTIEISQSSYQPEISEPTLTQSTLIPSESPKPEQKNYTKTLVILIIIIIIIDVIALAYYFKPDIKSKLASFFKPKVIADVSDSNTTQKCKDGTAYNKCSSNKPYYCYNGELLKSAYNCGCPAGYKVDFQDCKEI